MGLHWEVLLPLAVLALIVFGPKRLPELGSSIGKTIREFQKSMREVTNAVEAPSLSSSQPESAAPTLPSAPAQQAAAPEQPEQPGQPVNSATGAQAGSDS